MDHQMVLLWDLKLDPERALELGKPTVHLLVQQMEVMLVHHWVQQWEEKWVPHWVDLLDCQ